ncbi:hypothetical protein NPIL_242471 [Nephila pilipes]|uniref:Uncharacterized protein n=1 Tax=Nephila pilipes TaxID=299642 RepID=A0A8X6QM09_NEPPI|nr:hypothetical protein NPIL_242471 [Nephila pilipes]
MPADTIKKIFFSRKENDRLIRVLLRNILELRAACVCWKEAIAEGCLTIIKDYKVFDSWGIAYPSFKTELSFIRNHLNKNEGPTASLFLFSVSSAMDGTQENSYFL